MKKFIIIVALMLVFPAVSFGAPEGKKGASDQAYEKASPNAVFHRVGDWFATVGKSDEEKEAIKAQRAAKREVKRLEREAKKATKEAEQAAEEVDKVRQESKQKAQEMKREKKAVAERMQQQERSMMQKTMGQGKGKIGDK